MPHKNMIQFEAIKCISGKKLHLFDVSCRKPELSDLPESLSIVSSYRNGHAQKPRIPVSFRYRPHNLSVCLSALRNSSSPAGLHGQLLHLEHARTHRLHCHSAPCKSIIIMHSRNLNCTYEFRAEEPCSNLQTKTEKLTILFLFSLIYGVLQLI